MTIVAQVIKNKAVQSIFTISPNATVLEAIKIMADKGVGALVIWKNMRPARLHIQHRPQIG